jgi:branched-chain amino acid transport system permease protein
LRPEFWRTLLSPYGLAGLALLAAAPLFLPSYYLHIATLTLVYVGLGAAWNIVGGITGQISLAHSLFVGAGAMVSSALLLHSGINMWAGMLISALLAGMLGAAIAWIDFRFRLGHLSFALITLAFAEVGELVVTGWEYLGGASGLFLPKDQGRFLDFQFGGAFGNFWAILVLATMCLLVNHAVLNSRLGYYLRAIRDNENAAQAVGVALLANKIIAMVISAILSSLVGTLYARYLTFADPNLLASVTLTVEVVLIVTVGGLGTTFGPLVGAVLLVPLGEILCGKLGGSLPGLHSLVYGLTVIAVVLALPGGLAPALARLFKGASPGRRAGKGAPASG